MKIIVDVREHALIEKLTAISTESGSTITIETAPLLLGDISLRLDETTELLLFERKSFTDLLASIKDGRYEEQSHRLIHTSGMNPHNIVYILEGIFTMVRSPMDKKIILSAMTSLSFFKGFSVFRTATTLETAELIWAMATKIQKEIQNGRKLPGHIASYSKEGNATTTAGNATMTAGNATMTAGNATMTAGNATTTAITLPEVPVFTMPEGTLSTIEEREDIPRYSSFVKKVKRENITPENIGEILLSQIPGISSHIASEILKHFGGSFSTLIAEIKTNPAKLDTIYLESGGGKRRKLSSAVIQNLKLFL